jgi:hypothetical protein
MRGGDLEGLLAVLDPDLLVRTDMVPPGVPAESRGAMAYAKNAIVFAKAAEHLRPALVNGSIGVVLAPRGRLLRAVRFTIANGKVTELEIIGDAARLAALDLSIVD